MGSAGEASLQGAESWRRQRKVMWHCPQRAQILADPSLGNVWNAF